MERKRRLSPVMACVVTAYEVSGKGPYKKNRKLYGHPLGAEFAVSAEDQPAALGVEVSLGEPLVVADEPVNDDAVLTAQAV